MKNRIVVVGDLHLGVRNDSLVFAKNQLAFMDTMIDYCISEKIKTIVQLGDVFDRRKYTNHAVFDLWEEQFFEKLQKNKINIHILLGNHDVFFKNTNKVNSPSMFLSKYDNITIYEEPTTVAFGKTEFLILPWICDDNYAKSIEAIHDSKAEIAFGHLELSGFEMYRGQTMQHGMDRSLFSGFKKVISGHYHTISEQDNVKYAGCPFELTWADYNDPRGFFEMDTSTGDLKFIQNTNSMFARLEYDDTGKDDEYWKTFDVSKLSGKYVKLIVVHKNDPYQFDRLVDALYQANLEDFKIIEDFDDLIATSIDDEEIDLEDSMTLVDTYIDSVETTVDKQKLKTMMKTLYVSALEVTE